MSKKKVLGGIGIALLLALGGTYLGGRYYFTDHYYPRTTINGIDVSLKTNDEALELIRNHLNDYILGIKSADGDMTIKAEECGLTYTHPEDVSNILDKQNEDLWFEEVFNVSNYKAMKVALDEGKLQTTIDGLSCMSPAKPQKPVNAKIEYDKDKKEWVIIEEIIGNTILKDDFSEAVKESILNEEAFLDLTTNEYYKQPKYYSHSEEVVKAKETLDKYMSTVINYEDASLTYTLDKKDIHTFLSVNKDFKISFDKEGMKKYISKHLSPIYNTVGKKRKINSPGSGEFTASGGSYGWQVGLIAEREAMIKDIKSGKTVTREPKYIQDGNKKDRDNDIGNSYVDVSISQQHLWVVKDGKVVFDTSFVSGDSSKGHDTDKGVYMIEYKRRHYEMRDYNVTVDYWLPFNTDVGEGFHDAKWRSSFGGSIYTYNGSHGCVNLPWEAAKTMYNMLDIRFPVIVH